MFYPKTYDEIVKFCHECCENNFHYIDEKYAKNFFLCVLNPNKNCAAYDTKEHGNSIINAIAKAKEVNSFVHFFTKFAKAIIQEY